MLDFPLALIRVNNLSNETKGSCKCHQSQKFVLLKGLKNGVLVGSSVKIDSTNLAVGSRTPELVIALCGPIGSPIHEACLQIEHALGEFGYKTLSVRLSDLIRINAQDVGIPIDNSSKFTEIKTLIQAGDALRAQFGNDILAKLAIAKIRGDRQKEFGEFADLPESQATSARRPVVQSRINGFVM